MNYVLHSRNRWTLPPSRLHEMGSALAAQNGATVAPMTGVMPAAAADPVSLLTAAQFARHAQTFQALVPKLRRSTKTS